MWTATQKIALLITLAAPRYVSADLQPVVELPDGEVGNWVTTVTALSTSAVFSTVPVKADYYLPGTGSSPSQTLASTGSSSSSVAALTPAPVPSAITHIPVSIPVSSAFASEKQEANTLTEAAKPASAVVSAQAPVGSGVMTWAITNKWPEPLSISYLNNAGSPSAVGSPGAAPLGSTTNVVFPTGWAGRVYLGKTTNSADTLIEGSTTGANDVDVSYVDGFSVPVTCSVGSTVIVGCNIDLWTVSGNCSEMIGDQDVCLNPMQTVADGPATEWFLPCQGAAYTFPNDNVANNGNTGSPDVSCCIGTQAQGCGAPARQGKGNNKPSKRSLSTPEQPLAVGDNTAEVKSPNSPSLLPHAHNHLMKHRRHALSHGPRAVHNVK
ncbi:hypothetical protein MMC28_010996 [Mycoblastus sanguinarius]|nr:hypothetical protein [Mycoblastus sanguinarius]